MAGAVVENLSNRKLLVLVSFLMICLLVCFLLGGLVGKFLIFKTINYIDSSAVQYHLYFQEVWWGLILFRYFTFSSSTIKCSVGSCDKMSRSQTWQNSDVLRKTCWRLWQNWWFAWLGCHWEAFDWQKCGVRIPGIKRHYIIISQKDFTKFSTSFLYQEEKLIWIIPGGCKIS